MPAHYKAALKTAALVLCAGVLLSVLRELPRFDLAVVAHGLVQAGLVMAVATPIAGLVYLLGGGDEQAGVRAARIWGLISVIVLMLVQLAGYTLLSRFAAPV